MRLVSWNMNHGSRSAAARTNAWSFLRDDLKADIALVQEPAPPAGLDAVDKPIDATALNTNPESRSGLIPAESGPRSLEGLRLLFGYNAGVRVVAKRWPIIL